jgi:beta-lactamase class A/beta-lactamase class A VEB
MRTINLILGIILIFTAQAHCQEIATLKNEIQDLIKDKKAIVGVAIKGINTRDTLSINGDKHFPMQSVFKFPIALTTLSEIDKGNLTLKQKIDIKKEELLPGLWSPIREKYPEGTTLTVAEIIEYTVALSDNVGCDILLKLLGGPQTVEQYFSSLGFEDFAVKINEETMQNNWELQFLNWTTPKEANNILVSFYENKNGLLSKESYDFIWKVMKNTKTGKNRIKGQLPKEISVAHKTGWSGKHKETGITAAVNDIGIVFLPSGNHYTISVFITTSSESLETNEKIIADISKAAWDYFVVN